MTSQKTFPLSLWLLALSVIAVIIWVTQGVGELAEYDSTHAYDNAVDAYLSQQYQYPLGIEAISTIIVNTESCIKSVDEAVSRWFIIYDGDRETSTWTEPCDGVNTALYEQSPEGFQFAWKENKNGIHRVQMEAFQIDVADAGKYGWPVHAKARFMNEGDFKMGPNWYNSALLAVLSEKVISRALEKASSDNGRPLWLSMVEKNEAESH